ncbi:MAG: hypothetical protein R3C46_01240 [Hyphomonadaceae bacterium]
MSQLRRQRAILRVWIGLALGFLLLAGAAGAHTFSWGLPSLVGWKPDTAAAMMAGSATVAAILFGLAQFGDRQVTQRSQYCLEAATQGIRSAYEVLQQDHEDRNLVWVNAARLVLRSLKLASNLSEPDHIEAWKLFREEWRIRFLRFLDADLPYYFGVQSYSPFTNVEVTKEVVEDLHKRSMQTRTLTIEGLDASIDDSKMVTARALRAIYDFVLAYDRNDEPLDDVSDWSDTDMHELLNRDHYGLRAYLEVKRSHHYLGGRSMTIKAENEHGRMETRSTFRQADTKPA